MACSFISELSKLRKLSMESVENTASFDGSLCTEIKFMY